MILRAFSLYDSKALVYSPPFYAATDAAAIRMVSDTVADPQTSLSRHPSDYILVRVGEFDDNKGLFSAEQPLVHVVDVAALTPKVSAPLFDKLKAAE